LLIVRIEASLDQENCSNKRTFAAKPVKTGDHSALKPLRPNDWNNWAARVGHRRSIGKEVFGDSSSVECELGGLTDASFVCDPARSGIGGSFSMNTGGVSNERTNVFD
jgi:hypothetical protein